MKTAVQDQANSNDPPPAYTPSRNCGSTVQADSKDNLKDCNLFFALSPDIDPDVDSIDKAPWTAMLYVIAKDVPRLMREGFHWSQDNVHREEGYFWPNDVDSDLRNKGWHLTRRYFSSDLSDEAQWTAWLIVFAKCGDCSCARVIAEDLEDLDGPMTVPVLTGFRVSELSPDLVFASMAINDQERPIYYYSVLQPGWEFNAIYDSDLELDGWWPWPKKKERSREKATNLSGKDNDKSAKGENRLLWSRVRESIRSLQ